MKNKKHIAMRCNKEQFEAIKPKLHSRYILDLNVFEFYGDLNLSKSYLVNFYCEEEKVKFSRFITGREVHEEWNEKIFLEACGIETIPTLEEVKEYFKDAKTVECLTQKSEENISSPKGKGIHYDMNIYWIEAKGVTGKYTNLWNSEKGYAKILTYKTPKFEITKETVIKYQMEEEFPEVFEVKLEVGKWYIRKNNSKCVIFNEGNERQVGYGFGYNGDWANGWNLNSKNKHDFRLATPEEVTEALKKEAVRRGFVEGVSFLECKRQNGSQGSLSMCNGNYYFNTYEDGEQVLLSGGRALFCNGQWATVIQTKTIQQAEELLKELGHEIKIV